jgi:hypothetical protein
MRRFDREGDVGRAIAGGVVAGILAGLVLNVLMAAMTVSAGGDVWSAFKGAGMPFVGERAAQPGYDPLAIAAGILGHYLVSIGWGVLFGLLVYGLDRGLTVLAGAAYGLVVWLAMFWLVLPLAGLGAMSEQGANGMAVVTHVLFGLALGIGFLPFQVSRRFPRRRTREPVLP